MPVLFGQAGKQSHQPTGLGAARRGEGVCVCVHAAMAMGEFWLSSVRSASQQELVAAC